MPALPIDSSGNLKISSGVTLNVLRASATVQTILALAADVTNGRTSADITKPEGAIGCVLILDVTAVTGTGTFSASGCAIQAKSINGNYTGNVIVIPNPAISSVRLAGWPLANILTATPSAGSWHAVANAGVLPSIFRVVTTTACPNAGNSVTYSLECHWLY